MNGEAISPLLDPCRCLWEPAPSTGTQFSQSLSKLIVLPTSFTTHFLPQIVSINVSPSLNHNTSNIIIEIVTARILSLFREAQNEQLEKMSRVKSNFKPILPCDQPRIEHVRIRGYAVDAIARVVAQQWRQDEARAVWVVAGTTQESWFLYEDILAEGLAEASVKFVRAPDDLQGEGGVCVLSYELMKGLLFAHRARHGSWAVPGDFPRNITVVLNFGMVDTSFDMAMCFAILATAITRLPGFLLVVVSMKEATLPGLGTPSLARIQEVVVAREEEEEPVEETCKWDDQGDIHEDFAYAVPRSTALTDINEFEAVTDAQSFLVLGAAEGRPNRSQEPLLSVLIHGIMPYLARLPGTGDLFLNPYRQGWVVDDELGQAVMATVVPRSQHEMRQAMHLRNERGRLAMSVTCYGEREAGGWHVSSPEQHPGSYYAADLDRLLLLYLSVGSGSAPLFDMPVVLPRERPLLLHERLRRLGLQGLIREADADVKSGGESNIHNVVPLTDLGSSTVGVLVGSAMESVHASCLVAQLLLSPESQPPAVVEAIFRLAAVLETKLGRSALGKVILRVKPEYATPGGFTEDVGRGVAAPLYRRGPVWLAVMLWHRMRSDRNWRPVNRQSILQDLRDEPPILVFSDGRLFLDRLASFVWDDAWDRLAQYHGGATPPRRGGAGAQLDEQGLFFVEKAIARAFLQNLALVVMTPGGPFAHDLTSRRVLQPPREKELHQLCVEECWALARAQEGAGVKGFFGFYTSLIRHGRGTPESPWTWTPVNLTFVSAKAVLAVLQDVEEVLPGLPLLGRLAGFPVEPRIPFNLSTTAAATTTTTDDRPSSFDDIRVKYVMDEEQSLFYLQQNWPFVPGQDFAGRWSGFGCVLMVVRMAWTLFPTSDRPLVSAHEDAWARFVWADFPQGAREDAVVAAANALGAGPATPFAQLCRCDRAVDTIWNHSSHRLLLTTARGRDPAQVAREGVLTWDGVAPSSLARLVDSTSGARYVFNKPWMLQLDLQPAPGSTVSLRDVWHFQADRWAWEEGVCRVAGKQAYVVVAMVKHREEPQGPDLLRMFCPDGRDFMPSGAQANPVSWGFAFDQPIPAGKNLSVFYISIKQSQIKDIF